MQYRVHLIKDPALPDTRRLAPFVKDTLAAELRSAGADVYGAFYGLFGLATNELYVVTRAEGEVPDVGEPLSRAGYSLLRTIDLVPTVRPVDHSPRAEAGLYVFRWFDVTNGDVEEIAQLSKEAWVSFEADFEAEIQGLFAQADRSAEREQMLLLTRYSGLNAWQTSRAPSAEARENFMRRHALTLEAKPIATRLIGT